MEKITRRSMLGAASGAAVVSLAGLSAAAEKAGKGQRPAKGGDKGSDKGVNCLVTLQLKQIEAKSLDELTTAMKALAPIVATEIWTARSKPKARGCSVSGTVSGGPGGVGGSATITCTF